MCAAYGLRHTACARRLWLVRACASAIRRRLFMRLSRNDSMMQRILFIFLTVFSVWALSATNAFALEGDWEVGGAPSAFFMPSRNIYGGGAELFGRYAVLDGLSVSFAAGAYGVRDTDIQRAFGLYSLRAGLFYSLDVLQWVPAIGLNLSALFSEDDTYLWHKNGHGLSVDFDFQILYRGIRHLGIGVFFSYHIVLVDEDYMTAGLTFSWFSGMF